MKRLVAACAVSSMFMSGCGWILADVCGNGGCEPPKSIGASHDDDDDSTMALAIAGTAIVTAVVIALVAKGSREGAPAQIAPRPTPQQVAVIAPSPTGSDHDQLLQRMYVQGYLSASTGTCEATIAIGTRLATLSPSYHDRYVSDPTIATCLR